MEGWESPKFLAYLLKKISRDNIEVFWSFLGSSLFHKKDPQFDDLDDYVTRYDVIRHDVIGQSDMRTDNSGLAQFISKNRLVDFGPHKKWQPI